MSNPYNIDKKGKGYYFTTDSNVSYFAYFEVYDYYFSNYPLISHYIYTFNFEVESLNENKRRPKDTNGRVRDTISTLLEAFFQDNEKALIIICDSADGKHKGRKMIFDDWFNTNAGNLHLEKRDGYNASNGMEVYSSLILNRNHLFKDDLVEAYEQVRTELFKTE